MGVYSPTTWSSTTGISYTRLNNLEKQYGDASICLPPGIFTPYVMSGMVATKDGTTANQLDVTAGTAWLKQTDATVMYVATTASTSGEFTTTVASTTYYLDLNSDGTWSWGTSHSTDGNLLNICQVTTDASGNISTVTDERQQQTTFLEALTTGQVNMSATWSGNDFHVNGKLYGTGGVVTFGDKLSLDNGAITTDGSGNLTTSGTLTGTDLYFGPGGTGNAWLAYDTGNHLADLWTPQSGAQNGIVFITWSGSAQKNTFGVGLTGGAPAYVDQSGNYNGPVGGGIPTTRNGSATSAPIFTGTSTPSSPPTGSIWVKA